MKKPIRITEGSAKPFEPFWTVQNAEESESGEPEILFYGDISEYSWFGDEVTPAKFKADLDALGQGGPVTIRIHSTGGDVWAASAIRAMIMDYPGRVTTRIDGICASAATYVAMAGDVVKMQDSGTFMIHDPWTVAWGNVDDLKAAIDLLKTVKEGIVQAYQNKTHLETDKLAKMMSDVTWMTAQKAQELGFVDEVVSAPAKGINLQNTAILNHLRDYDNVPTELLDMLKPNEVVPVEAETSETVETVAIEETEGGDPILPAESGADALSQDAQKLRDYLDVFGPR